MELKEEDSLEVSVHTPMYNPHFLPVNIYGEKIPIEHFIEIFFI